MTLFLDVDEPFYGWTKWHEAAVHPSGLAWMRMVKHTGQRFMVDARNAAGQTALHIACACGRWKSVCLLLDIGADPYAVLPNGQTCMDLWDTQREKDMWLFLLAGRTR
jgi:hypothetical protein